MTLHSYQKPTADKVRYGLGWRCYRYGYATAHERALGQPWAVERWNGEDWEFIARAATYQRCREIPDEWRKGGHR